MLKSLTPVQIRKYFDHDSVKVLPILLKAADNLADAITICLEKLSTARGAVIAAMREELDMAPPPLEGDNYSELLSLPLLDAWYKEVLRVAAPVVVPRYTTTGMTYNGITIPPNTTIFFDLQALNKGAKFWENPDDFSPSRFLKAKRLGASAIEEKDAHTLSQYPFLPFSAGKRICPAFKLTEYIFKTFIATAVRSFDLKYGGALDNDIIVIVTPIVPSSSEGHRFGHN